MSTWPRRAHDGTGNGGLECNDSVLHACGGRREVAKEVLRLLDESLESGLLNVPRERCLDFLGPLEEAEGEREGKDRGSYRLLKAISVFLRLKGFNSRDNLMPVHEIDLSGHPLLAFTQPSRAAGASGLPPKAEPVVRTLELAVHLARAGACVTALKIAHGDLSPEGGDKCITEVVRLVRRMGIGSQSRFLEEVNLRGNFLDADSVRKIVEAAVKERCERAPAPTVPLWLDLSENRVRNPASLFQNLQAWAGWAHDRDTALCLADANGCSRKECPKGCMLHLPGFLLQCKDPAPVLMPQPQPEPPPRVFVDTRDPPPRASPTCHDPPPRASPTRYEPPPRASPTRREQPPRASPTRRDAAPASRRRTRPRPSPAAAAARSSPSRRRRRRAAPSAPRVELRPAPGVSGSSRSGSRSRSSRGRRGARGDGPGRRAAAGRGGASRGGSPKRPGSSPSRRRGARRGGGSASCGGSSASQPSAAAHGPSPEGGSCAGSDCASGSGSDGGDEGGEHAAESGAVASRSRSGSAPCSASVSDASSARGYPRARPQELDRRINRLIESLKTSAAATDPGPPAAEGAASAGAAGAPSAEAAHPREHRHRHGHRHRHRHGRRRGR